jgi:hypothetical protein
MIFSIASEVSQVKPDTMLTVMREAQQTPSQHMGVRGEAGRTGLGKAPELSPKKKRLRGYVYSSPIPGRNPAIKIDLIK